MVANEHNLSAIANSSGAVCCAAGALTNIGISGEVYEKACTIAHKLYLLDDEILALRKELKKGRI